jgi:hypothetical protein
MVRLVLVWNVSLQVGTGGGTDDSILLEKLGRRPNTFADGCRVCNIREIERKLQRICNDRIFGFTRVKGDGP